MAAFAVGRNPVLSTKQLLLLLRNPLNAVRLFRRGTRLRFGLMSTQSWDISIGSGLLLDSGVVEFEDVVY